MNKYLKINFTKWGAKYCTPTLSLIVSNDYYQLSFVVWNFHWWIIIKRKGGNNG